MKRVMRFVGLRGQAPYPLTVPCLLPVRFGEDDAVSKWT